MASETTATELLLAGDSAHTRADWEKAAATVLRKSGELAEGAPDSDVWSKLTRATLDGIAITPLGTADDTRDLDDGGYPGQSPFTRGATGSRGLDAGRDPGGWDVRAQFVDPDVTITTEHVMNDLENGVNSVWVSLGSDALDPADLPTVLDKVFLDLAPVILDAPDDPLGAARAFVAILDDRDIDAAPGTNLGANPIGAGADEAGTEQIVTEIATIAAERGTLALVVDGTDVHDLGASDVQELAYSLAVGAAYLRILAAAGYGIDKAAGLLEFRYAATAEQFDTIAKFRAARRLWNRVAELSGASVSARRQLQHAVTSRPMLTTYAPYVNMLRTTVASFAAGVGGAEAVTVLPFDAALGLPENFSRRIARNTSALLISESHVAKVTDPAGGAYAIEKLTDDVARAAWTAFGDIEDAGGIAAVLASGSLHAEIAKTVAKRNAQIGTRERPITGVSEFPDLTETLPERRPYPGGASVVARYGAPFETLRDQPADTPVFLATMGPIAAHTARATFISNLFASGGISTTLAGATDGVDDILEAYDGSPVVCLAGNDKAYAAWGGEVAAALRNAGAVWVVLAGKPVDGIEVDDSAAAGVDALELLHRTRGKLSA